MHFGNCIGGPFDGRPIAHPEPVYRLAINKHSFKPASGVLGGSDYIFGLYRWNGKVWTWEPPRDSE